MTAPRASLTLVVLAAGMGSRYGGLKQLDPVGPGGATLMDYSVFEAARAGFADVVFVIRPDMDKAFRSFAASRYGERLRIATVHQRLDDVAVPPGRTRPWGTGQAVLAAQAAVPGPFAVVNADDFYGEPAYHAVAAFLGGLHGARRWAVVGYRLGDTVSPAGGVNRAVCRTEGNRLVEMEEVLDITPQPDGTFRGRGTTGPVTMTSETKVSMNMWGFTTDLFAVLRAGFQRFLAGPDAATGEFLLPTAAQAAVRDGSASIEVLDARSPWFGMTHAADRPVVSAALTKLVAEGRYPERLW